MGDLPRHLRACLDTGKLAMLAILVSGGIVLQILVLYHPDFSYLSGIFAYFRVSLTNVVSNYFENVPGMCSVQ